MSGALHDQLSDLKGRYEIAPGAMVSIFIIADGSDEPILEGQATVISSCPHDPFWFRVRFLSEKVDRIRIVLPPSPHQTSALFAEAMRELIRTHGLNPWPEFFPDD